MDESFACCSCNRCNCAYYLFYMKNDNQGNTLRNAIWTRKINVIAMGISILLYVFNKCIWIDQTNGFLLIFCQCYLDDLVCPLFFLPYCQILLIWINREIRTYRGCLLLGMSAGLVWEYFAPIINKNAVSDPMDLLCYFVGISVYYILLRTQLREAR